MHFETPLPLKTEIYIVNLSFEISKGLLANIKSMSKIGMTIDSVEWNEKLRKYSTPHWYSYAHLVCRKWKFRILCCILCGQLLLLIPFCQEIGNGVKLHTKLILRVSIFLKWCKICFTNCNFWNMKLWPLSNQALSCNISYQGGVATKS